MSRHRSAMENEARAPRRLKGLLPRLIKFIIYSVTNNIN